MYTVALNPSTDYIIRVNRLKLGNLDRVKEDFKLLGGKGINVSRILKRIDSQSTALGFLGRFIGEFVSKWLEEEQIQSLFTTVKGDTRVNTRLKSDTEIEISGLGPSISGREIDGLKQALGTVGQEDIIVLSGNAPANLRKGFYQELIDIIRERGADLVIDITGDGLGSALVKKPLLIKSNNHELAEFYNMTFQSVEGVIPYGKKLLAEGVQNMLISVAGDGVLLFTEQGTYKTSALVRPLKSSIGAGDSMIVGFIGVYSRMKGPIEALKWGITCGSAVAFFDDLAARELIDKLPPEAEIARIDQLQGG